jgi:cytochrome aa3-600 menaquinol oxidase subunit 2
MTFSNTHLEFVDHGVDSGVYAMNVREKYGVEIKPHGSHGKDEESENAQEQEVQTDEESDSHQHSHQDH